MKSIRIRLVILFIVVTTTTLAAFEMYGQYQLSHRLEQRFSQLMNTTIKRLEMGMPDLVWNVDKDGILRNLVVEMLQDEINAIQVFDAKDRLLAAALRDPEGQVIKGKISDDFKGIRIETKMFHCDLGVVCTQAGTAARYYLGRVEVYFSRENIDLELHTHTLRWVTEALVVDLVLVLALALSLQMVFVPLQRLRDALFGLSDSGDDAVQELPEAGHTEFVDVIRGFNLTQRKVRQVMQRHDRARQDAHASAERAKQAFSELQSTQQSLVQAEKLASLGSMVAGVAHEINTPVGITLTSASVLLDASDKMQAQLTQGSLRKSEITAYVTLACKSARLILSNSERAANLIQSFKHVASDQTSEHRRSYDLQQYLAEIISSLRPRLKQSKVLVEVECLQAIELNGYPGAMAQIITNLTMNALVHAFKGSEEGRIQITAEQKADRVEMRFCDNGCGIAPEHIGKIFEPFFTTMHGQGGTGLGLNISYNIMTKRFGGTILVQSELGKGSCFVLNFPRTSPTPLKYECDP